MKAFVLLIIFAAVMPLANAEQGDAEDRALTAQMMHDAQAAQPLENSGYGDTGKTNVQSGLSKPNENSDTSGGQ
jgi:hypothetical protein